MENPIAVPHADAHPFTALTAWAQYPPRYLIDAPGRHVSGTAIGARVRAVRQRVGWLPFQDGSRVACTAQGAGRPALGGSHGGFERQEDFTSHAAVVLRMRDAGSAAISVAKELSAPRAPCILRRVVRLRRETLDRSCRIARHTLACGMFNTHVAMIASRCAPKKMRSHSCSPAQRCEAACLVPEVVALWTRAKLFTQKSLVRQAFRPLISSAFFMARRAAAAVARHLRPAHVAIRLQSAWHSCCGARSYAMRYSPLR
jgi:hypothetical protein